MSGWKDNLKQSIGSQTIQVLFFKDGEISDVFLYRKNKFFSFDSWANLYCELSIIADSYFTIPKNSMLHSSYNTLPITKKTLDDFLDYWSKKKNLTIKVNGKPYGE